MRKVILVIFSVFTAVNLFAQDFSNKGKDFYLCFPNHVPSGSNLAKLSIWITSDKASSGTITMPNGAFSSTFNIAANGIAEIAVPYADAHISTAETSSDANIIILQKSIRIKVDAGKPPVVAYAQQFAAARSAATLLLPVNVLGKKYYAISAAQDGTGGGKSQFQVIAIKNNTSIEITPVKNGVTQPTFTVNLPLAGDMIQYQSNSPSSATEDLTGTLIESVASGTGGCLPIAVFSGSSNTRIGTKAPSCSSNSYDPLFQQAYPVSTWGRNFGFVPVANYPRGVPYRVLASENNTNVFIDGVLAATINAGQTYPSIFSNQPATYTNPVSIAADKPIAVAEYMQSSACSGIVPTSNQGDPDMVLLNPIEQNISDITIFSTRQEFIRTQWVNVLMKTIAIPSFKISRNGCALAPPTGTWQPFLTLPGYSYLIEPLPLPGTGTCTVPGVSDSYRLVADSGFNAIAYGLGDNETYAYSAGTNVKDLYQQVTIQTEYGIETSPSVCTNAPFRFKISFPYCVDSITWDLSALPGPPNPDIVTEYYTTCVAGPGGPDSIRFVNGLPVYWYSLPTLYSFPTIGTYPVSITAYAPNTSGCGSEQLIDFDLEVIDPPPAGFTHDNPGCYADPVTVTETTPQTPKATYLQWWEFYDPATTPPTTTVYSNTSTPGTPLRTVSHTFTTAGVKRIRHASVITTGCISDTIVQMISLPDIPNATIAVTNTLECVNSTDNPTVTFTGTGGTAPYTFTYTINGTLPAQTVTTAGTDASITIPVPTNVVGLFDYEIVGVKNASPAGTACTRAITNQKATVNIIQQATITLTSAASTTNQTVCINKPIAPITYKLIGATNASIPLLPPGLAWSVTGSSDTGNVVTITGAPTSTGGLPFDYTYNFTIQTGGTTCTPGTTNVTLTVKPDHIISLNPDSPGSDVQAVCVNDPIKPIIFNLGGGATDVDAITGLPPGISYQVVDNLQLVISGTPTVVADETTFKITTNGSNCVTATTSFKLTVHAYPVANAGPDKIVLEGGSVGLEATGHATDLAYTWTPPEFLNDNKILSPRVISPKADMTYRLTVTGPGGCQTNDQVFVKLLRIPAIPNTFSPNGDGINDKWKIDFLNDYPGSRVQVFTRAGKLVFSSKGYNITWDGTIKGKPLPFDTYYYIIEIGSGRDPVTGYVTIMK
jgi:gliding motility-associated-like protein